MIATVSPGASSADHTINTLRYADRIKEKKVSDVTKNRRNKATSSDQEPRSNQRPNRPKKEPVDDLDVLHTSLRGQDTDDLFDSEDEQSVEEIAQLHRTVQTLFEEEESLLNLHMSVIQENAELLTEEGKLLQGVQSDAVVDYDIDNYASQLGTILDRKSYLINRLKEKLGSFRTQLQREEELSKKVVSLPGY